MNFLLTQSDQKHNPFSCSLLHENTLSNDIEFISHSFKVPA